MPSSVHRRMPNKTLAILSHSSVRRRAQGKKTFGTLAVSVTTFLRKNNNNKINPIGNSRISTTPAEKYQSQLPHFSRYRPTLVRIQLTNPSHHEYEYKTGGVKTINDEIGINNNVLIRTNKTKIHIHLAVCMEQSTHLFSLVQRPKWSQRNRVFDHYNRPSIPSFSLRQVPGASQSLCTVRCCASQTNEPRKGMVVWHLSTSQKR